MKTKTWLILPMLMAASAASGQQVEFFAPGIVRIAHTPDGQTAARKTEVVTATPQNVKVKKTQKGDGTTVYATADLTVTVSNGKVTFADAKGNILTSEGETKFTTIENGPDKGAFRVRQTFGVEAEEGIYGIGLLQNGKMSQRGEDRLMMQSNLDDYAHFYQSVKGYGIYWDNYSPTQIATPAKGQQGELTLESQVGTASDYYFMYGKDADGVIRQMRHLTGKVPMIPRWTYGFHQSRERYKSQAELLEVVHKYRELGIPFDGIIQDWQYWGPNYTWNAMEFLNPEFGRAQKMIDEVHRQHAHISLSIWSSFGPHTKPFAKLKEKGLMMNFETWPQSGMPQWPPRMDYPSGVRCYDVYSQEARDIYWEHLSPLGKMGIDAWWMDSTDPDHHSFKDSDLDEKTSMGSWRSVRNIFPLKAVGGVYDHQRAESDAKRVFILTRSYFAGQQRYGANTWSGDVGSSWATLRKQVPICLNYTLTANPYVNTDIGGFFANAYNRKNADNSATRNPQFQELYVRWMQFGVFCPMMRSHGTEVYREIYYYGQKGEPVYDALVDAIKLRYRLLPYIYSTAWQVCQNDDSFMRALMMDFRADKNTWDNNREFMFGRSLLVCPVVDPLFTQEKIVKTDAMSGWDGKESDKSEWPAADWSKTPRYDVYLPAGTRWIDFWTGETHDGGQTLNVEAPLSRCPVFVKAGSILTMGPDVQYAEERAGDDVEIVIYPGADATFTLYEDEGDSYNYEKGQRSTIEMKWSDKSKTLTIGNRQGSFAGMKETRVFHVRTHNGKTTDVTYTGNAVKVKNL